MLRNRALISSTPRGSEACQAEGEGAPVTVLGAQEEGGTQQVGGRYLEGARVPAACAGGAGEDSCCSPVVDMSVVSSAVGMWREEVAGLEGVLQAAGRRGMVGWGARSLEAWGRKRELLSSSWTAGSGSPLRTCRSWWWT